MTYLAIILSFSLLTKAGRPLSLIDDNVLDSVSATEKVLSVEDCEDKPGQRCVHFTECDLDGFITENSTQINQLIDVR